MKIKLRLDKKSERHKKKLETRRSRDSSQVSYALVNLLKGLAVDVSVGLLVFIQDLLISRSSRSSTGTSSIAASPRWPPLKVTPR